MKVTFEAETFRWETRRDTWYFAALPADLSEAIRELAHPPRGFGAVRVEAGIGATTWRTSIFPDARRGVYVLPLKRAVRVAESIPDDAVVTIDLELMGA